MNPFPIQSSHEISLCKKSSTQQWFKQQFAEDCVCFFYYLQHIPKGLNELSGLISYFIVKFSAPQNRCLQLKSRSVGKDFKMNKSLSTLDGIEITNMCSNGISIVCCLLLLQINVVCVNVIPLKIYILQNRLPTHGKFFPFQHLANATQRRKLFNLKAFSKPRTDVLNHPDVCVKV